MQIKKLKKLNKKVNAILDTLEPEEGLNLIERDLIASYLLKMYATIKEESGPISSKETRSNGIKVAPNIPSPEVELPPEVNIPTLDAAPKPTPTPSSTPSPVPLQDSASIQEIPSIKTDKTKEEYRERLQILEEITNSGQSSKDLSDKLRMQPINDISKAMSINERIFTVNELFGGDKEAFDRIIQQLNNASGFEAVKHYLAEHVMGPFDWGNPAKAKKLRQFLSLVQRKHLS